MEMINSILRELAVGINYKGHREIAYAAAYRVGIFGYFVLLCPAAAACVRAAGVQKIKDPLPI